MMSETILEELEYYRNRCSLLESKVSSLEKEKLEMKDTIRKKDERISQLELENKNLKEENTSLRVTVHAVTARSINTKSNTNKKSERKRKHKKSGRRNGHKGKSRRKPEHIDARVELDQQICSECGSTQLSEPTHSYTRVVEDIVPARIVVTEYRIVRRYCRKCKKQVSPKIPCVLPNERFGLRLMLLIVSLKVLGLSYGKITGLFKLLFNLDVTEASVEHSVMKVAGAFAIRYNELIDDLVKERNIHGDETSWRIDGKNHWLWAFVGRWTVVYEIDRSRGRDVPSRMLKGYDGNITSDSWAAWNYAGASHQRCHYHYGRDLDDTMKYKNPGKPFRGFAKKLKRMLHDSQKADRKVKSRKKRVEAKARFEKRLENLISEQYGDRQCIRFVKRLKREKSMLFTFLEIDGVQYHNNDAERAIRPCVVIRKITYGNKSLAGAKAQARLMSIKETCIKRGQNFYDYALEYLNTCSGTSKR